MHSTPDPKQTDPHDALAARADEELVHAYEQIKRDIIAEGSPICDLASLQRISRLVRELLELDRLREKVQQAEARQNKR